MQLSNTNKIKTDSKKSKSWKKSDCQLTDTQRLSNNYKLPVNSSHRANVNKRHTKKGNTDKKRQSTVNEILTRYKTDR